MYKERAKKLFEQVGYKRVFYFGVLCMVMGLLFLLFFDEMRRGLGIEFMEDSLRWIKRKIGKNIFSGFYIAVGIIFAVAGYKGMQREKKKEVKRYDQE